MLFSLQVFSTHCLPRHTVAFFFFFCLFALPIKVGSLMSMNVKLTLAWYRWRTDQLTEKQQQDQQQQEEEEGRAPSTAGGGAAVHSAREATSAEGTCDASRLRCCWAPGLSGSSASKLTAGIQLPLQEQRADTASFWTTELNQSAVTSCF